MEIKATNINDAFDKGVALMSTALPLWTRTVAPRGAPTLEAVEPVITHYVRPTERVLFSPARDANPFLHFFESLWLLAGRRDVAFLKQFASRMAEFSDDGETFNGAYGHRWRGYYGYDQLTRVVDLLKHEPDSRRAVITMWNTNDLLKSSEPDASRDVPCNTQVYVKIRDSKLDITVTCRSNDMLWGAYGANVVQFSMLQEYLACKLDVPVGRYTQVSDSFHVYLPPHPGGQVWARVLQRHVCGLDPYSAREVRPFPLGAEDSDWDKDMCNFFKDVDMYLKGEIMWDIVCAPRRTEFWNAVVQPIWEAWFTRDVTSLDHCLATDWQLACTQWIMRHPGTETKYEEIK